jgi:ABC-2 type transport system permease protein
MLTRIIRHEWRVLNADKTVYILLALFSVFVAYAIYNGASFARAQRASLEFLQNEREERFARNKAAVKKYERERIADPKLKPPPETILAAIASAGYNVALPPAPLAALSVGQGELYPPYTKVSLWNSKQDLFSEVENKNPLNLLSGRFDLVFFAIYLYPLLILALSYNLLSEERENGTLALLAAQPVSLARIVIGKVVLRFGVVLAATVLFSLAAALVGGANLFDANVALLVGWWILTVALYGSSWFALACLVNAGGGNSAANAALLAACWLGLTLVVPSLLNLLVTSVYPTPSRVELVAVTRQATVETREAGSQLLAVYLEDHPELAPGDREKNIKDSASIDFANHREVERRVAPLAARFDEQLAKQQRVVGFLSFLSPSIAAQEALEDIAGTGAARYQNFRRQTATFHSEWQNRYAPKLFLRATRADATEVDRGRLTPADYDDYPRFSFAEETANDAARRILLGLTALAIPLALVVFLAVRRMRRCRAAA